VARCIDLAIQVLIMELAFRVSTFLPAEGLLSLSEAALVPLDIAVGLTAFVVYLTLSEYRGGATFGKFCADLRVVGAQGTPLTLRAALIRNLALPLDLFLFGLVAYSAMSRSERRQRVGDHWAATIVVRRGDTPRAKGLRGWPVAALVSVALVLMSYVIAK